jgi:hypothetical protein
MVYQLFRQGRLHLTGGGWGMSDEATTSYHAIIDHFTYSLRFITSLYNGTNPTTCSILPIDREQRSSLSPEGKLKLSWNSYIMIFPLC